jgi:hypothetical protein
MVARKHSRVSKAIKKSRDTTKKYEKKYKYTREQKRKMHQSQAWANAHRVTHYR